jgi:hypothetical protein
MTSRHYYKIIFWFIGIALLTCVLHVLLVQQAQMKLTLGVIGIYAYNVAFSLVLIILVKKYVAKLEENTAWLYFSGLFLKLGIFALLFNGIVFKEQSFSGWEKASVVIPVLIFFAVEAVIVSKIISKSGR